MKGARLRYVVITFTGLLTIIHPALGQSWTPTSAPLTNWTAVTSSADGMRLVAVANYPASPIFISTDSGVTWTPSGAPVANWCAVAASADGLKLAASGDAGLYTSIDFGTNWVLRTNLSSCTLASSADGTRLAMICGLGTICLSADSGATWTASPLPNSGLNSVASSADGARLVATGFCTPSCGVPIYISTNSGASWVATPAVAYHGPKVASSADGSHLVALDGYLMLISRDWGATWSSTSPSPFRANLVACSADGAKLVAAPGCCLGPGAIYTSVDGGASWTPASGPSTEWSCVASSADGGRFVAAVPGGGIYTWQSAPTPSLSITSSGPSAVLSWVVPSMDFTLQDNSDLTMTNWADVTTVPTLNLTNLQYQVTAPAPGGQRFFRLKH